MEFERICKKRKVQLESNSSDHKLHNIVEETSKNINQLGHMVVSLHNTLNTVCKLLENIEYRQLQTTLEIEKVKKELSDLQTHMMDICQDNTRRTQIYNSNQDEFKEHGNYIN